MFRDVSRVRPVSSLEGRLFPAYALVVALTVLCPPDRTLSGIDDMTMADLDTVVWRAGGLLADKLCLRLRIGAISSRVLCLPVSAIALLRNRNRCMGVSYTSTNVSARWLMLSSEREPMEEYK